MPLTPDNPPTVSVPMPVDREVNRVQIIETKTLTPVDGSVHVSFSFMCGHDDGGGGTTWLPKDTIVVAARPTDMQPGPSFNPHGDALLAIMGAAPEGASNYVATKASWYALLAACKPELAGAVV